MKINLSIIQYSFAFAGSEKFFYEVVRSINKDKFNITICTDKNISNLSSIKNYYFKLLSNEPVKIKKNLYVPSADSFINKLKALKQYFPAGTGLKSLIGLLENTIIQRKKKYYASKLHSEIQKADKIIIADIFNLYLLKELQDTLSITILQSKLYFHLHCHLAQMPFDFYSIIKSFENVNFILMDKNQLLDFKKIGLNIQRIKYLIFPLKMTVLKKKENIVPFCSMLSVFKIAIISRVHPQKPIENFILAFEQLVNKIPDKLNLVIIGSVQDNEYYSQLKRIISERNLDQKITFLPHQNDLNKGLTENNISLVWGHSCGSFFGYSSLETFLNGVPVMGYNLCESEYTDKNSPFLIGDNYEELASITINYLNDQRSFNNYFNNCINYILENNVINDSIEELENFYRSA